MRKRTAEGFWSRLVPTIRQHYPSCKEFCRQNGINYQTFFNYKKDRFFPPMDVIRVMAEALDVSLDYLVYGRALGLGLDDCTLKVLEGYRDSNKTVRAVVESILIQKSSKKDGCSQKEK